MPIGSGLLFRNNRSLTNLLRAGIECALKRFRRRVGLRAAHQLNSAFTLVKIKAYTFRVFGGLLSSVGSSKKSEKKYANKWPRFHPFTIRE